MIKATLNANARGQRRETTMVNYKVKFRFKRLF